MASMNRSGLLPFLLFGAVVAFGGAVAVAATVGEGAKRLGNTPADLIAIAMQYVGVLEVPLGSNRGPMVDKFNVGTGKAWCGYFVSYVLRQAGIATKTIAGPQGMYDRAKALGVLSTTPSLGAVFLQITNGEGVTGVDKGGNHTGFVSGILPGGKLATVEGNASNGVRNYHFRPTSSMTGYIPFAALPRVFS